MKKDKKKLAGGIILSLAILVFSIGFMPKILTSLKFGLDLKGGFEVLYKIDSIDGAEVTDDMVTSTYKTIMKRIDVLGVSEPEIIVEGKDRIRVQLAGIKDSEAARNQIGKVANLTFRDTNDKLLMKSDVISGAKLSTDEYGKPAVSLTVKDKDTFYKVTKKLSESDDNLIVIWLDFRNMLDSYESESSNCGSLSSSRCISAATVSEAFSSDVIIKGNFTQEEAKNLAELINSGSLQTKLTEISSKTVSASFGEDSLKNTFIAGLIGLIGVSILMIILYHFSGVITSIGLILYTFLSFLLFWLVGGVLTLPGIAAMLLGIGMAVDSNIIAFSKIKDEMKKGLTFKEAYKIGNKDSFKTILDANITTLIVAVILFVFGESSVKGFATMLMISIFVTMVIMVGLIRTILNLFVKSGYFDNKPNFFMGINDKRLNRTTFKLKCNFKKAVISLIVIIIGITFLILKGFNLGIDFKGGSSITLKGSDINIEEVEKTLTDMNYNISSTSDNSSDLVLTIEQSLDETAVNKVKNELEDKYNVSVDIGVVSNVVKKELVKNTIYSLILATLGILLYISFRFTFRYALGAIIALIHDVLIVIGIFALFKIEVNTVFIAAILSIIGYSINDTVVMFDYIKEIKNKKYKNILKSKEQLNELIDDSVNNIKSRSIVTSITTLIPVIALIFLGSKSIFNFNIAMFIGVLVGTYSSLFIATYVYKKLEYKFIGKKEKKWYEINEKEEKKVKGVNC